MSTLIPTMSSLGWINTPEKKADYLLSCFITNNKSQSPMAQQNSTSLQYLIQEYANRRLQLQEAVSTALDAIMSNGFKGDFVRSTVTVTVPNEDKPTEMSIVFNCVVTIDGTDYTVGKLVSVIDSKVSAINEYII